MVSRFRRTISFPKPVVTRQISLVKSFHIRSVSLPCRSHPLISQLTSEINDLKAWKSHSVSDRNASWLCDGLIRLKCLHDSFNDFLQLQKTQESLRQRSDWVEKLLHEFLQFVDVFGIFRATLVTIKEEQSLSQVAIRRRDESEIVSYVKNAKKLNKEIVKLASTTESIRRCSQSPDPLLGFDDDAELAGILQQVNQVTVTVTTTMLNAFSSCGKSLLKNKQSKVDERLEEFRQIDDEKFSSLKKMGDQEVRNLLKKMQELENCAVEIENESGRMFRSLINNRVSLLNMHNSR
ncbi:hypothetical protein ACHQM5_024420 [Ranunculus cassubicifolius]